jgi:hypothetical protein
LETLLSVLGTLRKEVPEDDMSMHQPIEDSMSG